MLTSLLGESILMDAFQNSLVLYLCAYVGFLFDDLRPIYTGQKEWERDKARLVHEIQQHGGQVMTITLPAVGKAFDKALAEGSLNLPSGCYLSKTKAGEQVPVFLRDLHKQVFSPSDGQLRVNPSIEAILALRQIYFGAKKITLQCSERRIRDEVKDFYAIEVANRSPSHDWSSSRPIDWRVNPRSPDGNRVHFCDLGDPKVGGDGVLSHAVVDIMPVSQLGLLTFHGCDWHMLQTLQRVCDIVFSQLGDFADEAEFKPKHGRGAVADLKAGTSKYTFADWPETLSNFYPPDYYATHNLGSDSELGDVGLWRNREVPSKLIAVPKTHKGPRLIASEPSQNQWIQQLLMQQLMAAVERTLLRHCISFRDQRPNQEAARQGSIDGSVATIDLSSASDRLTCWVVERAARANESLLNRLHACRTKWVSNKVENTVFDVLKLKKFSTMGSAVIFPMQSIVYACIAIAAVFVGNPEKRAQPATVADVEEVSRLVRVFGDDIVVPTYAYSVLERYMFALGLKVNASKTFTTGNFRESCGVDAFMGYDVSPIYLRHVVLSASFEDVPSLIEVGNNFHKAGWWNVAAWLSFTMSRWEHLIPIVDVNSGQLGHHSFCGTRIEHLKKRWNPDHHGEEVRVLQSISKARRARGTARQDLLQWFTESPEPDFPWEAGTDLSRVVKSRLGWQSTDLFS